MVRPRIDSPGLDRSWQSPLPLHNSSIGCCRSLAMADSFSLEILRWSLMIRITISSSSPAYRAWIRRHSCRLRAPTPMDRILEPASNAFDKIDRNITFVASSSTEGSLRYPFGSRFPIISIPICSSSDDKLLSFSCQTRWSKREGLRVNVLSREGKSSEVLRKEESVEFANNCRDNYPINFTNSCFVGLDFLRPFLLRCV